LVLLFKKERLRPIAARSGRTVAELAVAWVLARPEVTAAIVGGRKPAQVEQVVGGAEWDLSESEIAQVGELLAEREALG
jgi:aryl-alcohol dehydrogenase-like predicted oxidoreductase